MTALDLAISGASHELGLPSEIVGKVYRAYWLALKQVVQALPLKEDLTDEDFSKLRTSFNIPSLGKMFVTWDRYQGVKNRFKYLTKLREKVQNVQGPREVQIVS